MSIMECNQYSNLFKGRNDFHGCYIPPKVLNKSGEKQEGKSWTSKDPLTAEDYKNHLEGKKGLGIVPINLNNNVRFSVIDIDVYPIDPMKYINLIKEYDLPFNVFRSKSKGLHLYIFWAEDVSAEKAIEILKIFVTIFGLPLDTETFPKQKKVNKETAGNWINLPYFGNTRKLLNDKGEEVELSEALEILQKRCITFNMVETLVDSLPLFDAPPCLQSLYICNDVESYEMYLFNIAIYYKASSPETWRDEVHKANERLEDHLETRRVDNQVCDSQEKKTYSYRCSESPICDRCDKKECSKRAFGKGGSEVSNFTFEEITQVLTKPPHYIWLVNGKKMTFLSERELRDQNIFANYCMRYLHLVPNMLKTPKWNKILMDAFKDVKIEEVDEKDDISKEAFLKSYIHDFILDTVEAKSVEQLASMGRVYYEAGKGLHWFKKEKLVDYLFNVKNFRTFDTREIFICLKDAGAKAGRIWIPQKKVNIRAWSIHEKDLDKLGERKIEIDNVDFDILDEERF